MMTSLTGGTRDAFRAWSGVWVLGLALLWLVCLSWARVLTLPDEGRYVGVAWEMLRSHSWLVPRIDGMPYFHKPPLFYWLTQGSLALFGLHAWAARLPSLLAAWALVAGVYGFVRAQRGEQQAALAVTVLVTLPLFYGGAQFANLDMLVASLIGLSVLAGATVVLRAARGEPARGMALATAALAALAVLAKGLIGIVLPGAILALWLVLRRDGRGLRALLWWPAIVVFLAIALPWFVLMQLRYPGFFHYFFVYQHFERFAASGFNNSQPFWFYLPVVAGLALPWSLWAGGALRRSFWRESGPGGVRVLYLVWLAVVIGFFSLPQSKLIGYVLPALAPLALLMADVITAAHAARADARVARLFQVSLLAAAGICVVAVGVAAMNPRDSAARLGAQVRSAAGPQDLQVALHSFPFDLGFYTASREPVRVIDDWANPEIPTRDNWRKELYDAAQFEPQVGARVLLGVDAFTQTLCAAPAGQVYWIWGRDSDQGAYAVLRGLAPTLVQDRRRVWRVEAGSAFSAQLCGQRPTAGSPGTSGTPAQ